MSGTAPPLADVTVIDVTSNVAGPFATLILGDLGATVIKVERPGLGDDTRRWGPPFAAGQSVTNLSLNRNKRSVELDLRSDADLAELRRLIAGADVFVQNLRPGALARFGLDFPTLSAEHPALVYCDMSGFGGVGPLAGESGYDPLMQAFSGLMRFNSQPGGEPARVPVSILDKGTGMWAAIGVVTALYRRQSTGVGGHVQTSLFETAANWLSTQLIHYVTNGVVTAPMGSRTSGIAPYQVFATKDGHALVAAGNDTLWRRLCECLGADDLPADPRFDTNPHRVDNADALEAELDRYLGGFDTAELCEKLRAAGVPVSPLNSIGDFADSPQFAALGLLQPVTLPNGESVPTMGPALTFDGVRPPARSAPPALGEANGTLGTGPDTGAAR